MLFLSSPLIFFFVFLFTVILVLAFLILKRERGLRASLTAREQEMNSRLYELTILKELQERFGYSLNVAKIVDIISGSLRQFIEFSAVAYLLVEPDHLFFKCHLEQSVSRSFVDEMKERMRDSLSALESQEVAQRRVEETLTGAILTEEFHESVRSFFNIPLSIGERMAGVLTVASVKEGLFQEKDVTIIYKIVKQASHAVQKLEEVLAIEQEKVNAMVQSLSEGLIMVDNEFRIIVANPLMRRLVNIQDSREITIFDLIDTVGKKLDIRGQLEESIKLDKTIVSRDVIIGNSSYEVYVSPVRSLHTEGVHFGAVVLFHDITHEKELERLRQDFTSMMVHELRSPLDGINKISSILEKQSKRQRREMREMIATIGESSKEMLSLVSDLLDVAKIEAGKFSVFPQKTDLIALIKEKVAYFTQLPDHATLYVDNKLGEEFTLECDPFRIRQVFMNIVGNAIKFTPPTGRIDISLFVHKVGARFADEAANPSVHWFSGTISGETVANSVVVGVSDTGEGIEKDKVGELFNKFKQLQARSEKRGTGLGLIIAKGIVEAHGGIIGVGSERGVGSTFFFTLPLKGN